MTLTKFLLTSGLLTDQDNKIAQMKALTPADRAFFVERAKIEQGIEIETVVAA